MSLTPSPCNVWWAPITVRRREGRKEGEEMRGGRERVNGREAQKRKEESGGCEKEEVATNAYPLPYLHSQDSGAT